MCCLANTGGDNAHMNKSLLCVPMDTPGVTVSRTIDKLGMRSSDTAEVYLENVRIPRRYLIGEEGKGFTYQMIQFQEERLILCGFALTQMQRVIDETIEYTKERGIFGDSVLSHQSVRQQYLEGTIVVWRVNQ